MRTVKITVEINSKIEEYLQHLVDTGLFGNDCSQAANYLICRQLEEMFAKGLLRAPWKK